MIPRALARPGGLNLHLKNVEIEWQGYAGMTLKQVTHVLSFLLSSRNTPHYLLVHCGANDIGKLSTRDIMAEFDKLLQFTSQQMPKTKMIWSQMLPRKVWRYSNNNKAMEAAHRRVNSYIANRTLKSGGYYMKHPDLHLHNAPFFASDWVHLTEMGSDLFLNYVRATLIFVIHLGCHVNP